MNNSVRSHLIRVTMICNERCSFCNVTKETEPDGREKSILEILREVQKIIKSSGGAENVKISLSGGEPTLRKDLTKIVSGIRKLGVKYIEIQTNAVLLHPSRAQSLIESGVNKFFISFHSHDKSVFESYVGLPGIFERVVENIKALGSYPDIEIILNPVLSTQNSTGFGEYFSFIKQTFPFITYISLSFIQPHGKAKSTLDHMLDYETVHKKLYGILDFAASLGFVVNNPYCGLPVCVLGWEKYADNCIEVIEGRILRREGRERNDTNKCYLEACRQCSYRGLCGGVWKEYETVFGDRGIHAIL